MNKPIKCAVIGTGYFGCLHAEKYTKIKHCILSAVADRDPMCASQTATRYSTTSVTDYRELLGKVDAVSIATSASSHYSIAHDFLEHGTHVLIEKPMVETLSEADTLIALAEKNKCILQVGHIERFNPVLNLLDERTLDNGFIQITRLTPFPNRNHDVCAIMDLMIHDLDLVIDLVTSDIRCISAKGLSVLSDEIDIANARIEFENHCVADLSVSRVSKKNERNWRIFTEDRYISMQLDNNSGRIYWKDSNTAKILSEHKNFSETDMLLDQIQHFIDCIYYQRQPLVNGHIGRRALEAALQVSNEIKKTNMQ